MNNKTSVISKRNWTFGWNVIIAIGIKARPIGRLLA